MKFLYVYMEVRSERLVASLERLQTGFAWFSCNGLRLEVVLIGDLIAWFSCNGLVGDLIARLRELCISRYG
ncbi:hypothetical protein QVD17_27485 [Tagetes erecta]|uniref:Uncharacterized protein n=1 Tax=Tagetes erecta TaxID=13708 RepID=A0AAD8K8R7_TARER|nr:hypothetical protein QVD17_27485 [Tagetes erecta]